MLAPLGAFGSAAPFSQRGVAGRVEPCVRNLQTPKPLTDPALPANPRQKTRLFPFCRPSDAKISIFGRPFADRKFIKNRTPQKPARNRKKQIPNRKMPISDGFREPFWHHCCSSFHHFAVLFSDLVLASILEGFLIISWPPVDGKKPF